MEKLTFKEIRKMFWNNATPEMNREYRVRKTQNDYSCDIRTAFVDFIDSLERDGKITESQPFRITL